MLDVILQTVENAKSVLQARVDREHNLTQNHIHVLTLLELKLIRHSDTQLITITYYNYALQDVEFMN